MEFAKKLRQIRLGCEMTQDELAKKLDVSRRTIMFYEQGETLPRYERIYESLAEIFKTPVDFWKCESDGDFEDAAKYAYGSSGKQQADKLVTELSGLFAGGRLSENDTDAVMLALQQAYWKVKEQKAKDKGIT